MRRFYLLRHGVTEWNRQRRIQGCRDIPLTPEGVREAKALGELYRDTVFDKALTSPLSRAKSTAETFLLGRDVPLETEDRLREISFGVLEGLVPEEADAKTQEVFRLFFQQPELFPRPEGGENIPDLVKRADSLWGDLLTDPSLEGKNILLSTHGTFLRALLMAAEGSLSDFWRGEFPPNCSMSLLEEEEGRLHLRYMDRQAPGGTKLTGLDSF